MGKIWPSQLGPFRVRFYNFDFSQRILQQIVHKRGLNDLDSYKNIFGQRSLAYHKKYSSWKLHNLYSEINTT